MGFAMRLFRSRRFWLAALISLGIMWRLGRYLLNFPIWCDEAAVGLNVLDRTYAGLLQPLAHIVACPIGFLWISKWIVEHFGTSTFAVRFVPLMAASISVLLMYPIARRLAGPWVALLATGLLACSLSPARFSNDFKPYSIDLLLALTYTGLGLWSLRQPRSAWPALLLITLTPVALLLSYPSVFVAAAISLAMAIRLWRVRSTLSITLYVIYSGVWLGSFALLFLEATRGQLHATHQQGIVYAWGSAFPPHNWGLCWWLIKAQFGNMMSYPMGGEWGASLLITPLCWLGMWRLWHRGRRAEMVLLVTPFVGTLAASSIHAYPYGRDARVEQHLVPAIMLLASIGLWTAIIFFMRGLAGHRRAIPAAVGMVCSVLVIFAVVAGTTNVLHPWISRRSEGIRTLMRDIFRHRHNAAYIVAMQEPPLEARWYLHRWPCVWRVGLPANKAALKSFPADLWIISMTSRPSRHLASVVEASMDTAGRPLRVLQRYHKVLFHGGSAPLHAQVIHFQCRP